MKNFTQYLNEAPNVIPKEHLMVDINQYMKDGEILKPKYDILKQQVNRAIEAAGAKVFDDFLAGRGGEMYERGMGDLSELISSYMNYIALISVSKKLPKLKKFADEPAYKALAQVVKDYLPLAQGIKDLKDKVVKTSQKRAEKKQEAEVQLKARMHDASSLVKTLTQHHDEFVDRAKKVAGDYYDQHANILKKAGSVDAIAPRPTSRMSTSAYRSAQTKRDFYTYIERTKKSDHINQAGEAAHANYMAWVHKMIEKIGKPVVKSKVVGSPWTGSTLTVTTDDGEDQQWHTQMIINQSKYGKLFNQFPSRKKN